MESIHGIGSLDFRPGASCEQSHSLKKDSLGTENIQCRIKLLDWQAEQEIVRFIVMQINDLTNNINRAQSAQNHYEWQYLDLMRHIWEHGSERVDRTGIGTRSIAGAVLRFELSNGAMPLLTTKRVYWKTATREMLWFLTGDTNIRP